MKHRSTTLSLLLAAATLTLGAATACKSSVREARPDTAGELGPTTTSPPPPADVDGPATAPDTLVVGGHSGAIASALLGTTPTHRLRVHLPWGGGEDPDVDVPAELPPVPEGHQRIELPEGEWTVVARTHDDAVLLAGEGVLALVTRDREGEPELTMRASELGQDIEATVVDDDGFMVCDGWRAEGVGRRGAWQFYSGGTFLLADELGCLFVLGGQFRRVATDGQEQPPRLSRPVEGLIDTENVSHVRCGGRDHILLRAEDTRFHHDGNRWREVGLPKTILERCGDEAWCSARMAFETRMHLACSEEGRTLLTSEVGYAGDDTAPPEIWWATPKKGTLEWTDAPRPSLASRELAVEVGQTHVDVLWSGDGAKGQRTRTRFARRPVEVPGPIAATPFRWLEHWCKSRPMERACRVGIDAQTDTAFFARPDRGAYGLRWQGEGGEVEAGLSLGWDGFTLIDAALTKPGWSHAWGSEIFEALRSEFEPVDDGVAPPWLAEFAPITDDTAPIQYQSSRRDISRFPIDAYLDRRRFEVQLVEDGPRAVFEPTEVGEWRIVEVDAGMLPESDPRYAQIAEAIDRHCEGFDARPMDMIDAPGYACLEFETGGPGPIFAWWLEERVFDLVRRSYCGEATLRLERTDERWRVIDDTLTLTFCRE